MFQKARNVAVVNSTLTEVHEGINGRQILAQSPYVVHGAIHDSGQRYPPSQCHPGTREDVLDIALAWIDTPLDARESSQIFWLSGPAGVGKTSIAQSLCQRLSALGRLGGDFFLSRSVAGHSSLHTLVPTLVYQLARASPDFSTELDAVIKVDESILTKNIELQLEHLLVIPLTRVQHSSNTLRILVIDGLDEAGDERDQASLLRLLGTCFSTHHLPLKIILTSRPEPWIKKAFSDAPLLRTSHAHFLHRTSQTDTDIRTLLHAAFADIQRTHELMQHRPPEHPWPPPHATDDIVDNASGQFIYAATVLRYIADPNGHPVDRLHWIMAMPSARHNTTDATDAPFLALDTLYQHVLSTSLHIDRTLLVLGAVLGLLATSRAPEPDVAAVNSLPVHWIERILRTRAGDGFLALRTIHSLVDVPPVTDQRGVNFHHKSFQDFLLDPSRSGKYFIDMNHVYTTLTMGAFSFARDCVQTKPPSYHDLKIIQGRWRQWWLRAAASDQVRLLEGIKEIDQDAFYWNHTTNVAWAALFLPYNNVVSLEERKEIEAHSSSGTIAESILQETRQWMSFAYSLKNFRTVAAVFGPYLCQGFND